MIFITGANGWLGLNLVNSATKFHNGILKLLDAKPSGLIVLIEIPNS